MMAKTAKIAATAAIRRMAVLSIVWSLICGSPWNGKSTILAQNRAGKSNKALDCVRSKPSPPYRSKKAHPRLNTTKHRSVTKNTRRFIGRDKLIKLEIFKLSAHLKVRSRLQLIVDKGLMSRIIKGYNAQAMRMLRKLDE